MKLLQGEGSEKKEKKIPKHHRVSDDILKIVPEGKNW